MTNTEYYQAQAREAAQRDFNQDLEADPGRHGAIEKSAWAKYYIERFERLAKKSGY